MPIISSFFGIYVRVHFGACCYGRQIFPDGGKKRA